MAIFLTEDRWNIARGIVKDTSFINKYGAVPAMSQNTTGSVWDVSDTVYPWATLNGSAHTLTIDCASADEVGHHVTIQGLDANWNLLTETVTLSSQTGNTTTNQFMRVYNAYYTDGSASTNTGNIDIKIGATVVARILAGAGITKMAVYTVPAGYTAYVVQGVASIQAGADATGNMFVRQTGNVNFRIAHTFEVSGTGGTYTYTFPFPVAIPEKSDIDVRATVRSNNARLTATFDLLLIKND